MYDSWQLCDADHAQEFSDDAVAQVVHDDGFCFAIQPLLKLVDERTAVCAWK